MSDKTKDRKLTVMLELRPAFDGYAGIPQETRLLFRGLRMIRSVDVSGMLQMSHRILAKGVAQDRPLLASGDLGRRAAVLDPL